MLSLLGVFLCLQAALTPGTPRKSPVLDALRACAWSFPQR